MNQLGKTLGFAALAAGALGLWAPRVDAAIIPFTSSLTTQNADLGGGTGNFGTVGISLNNTTGVATFTFTAAPGREFGDGGVADLNLTPGTLSPTFISATPGLAASQSFASTGSGQVDGFGVFNLTTTIGNFSTGQTTIVFSVQSNSFIGATSLSQILTPNASGFDAAAHERIVGTDTTGFVAETGGTVIPEPASLAIFGTALAGLGLIRRRRKSV